MKTMLKVIMLVFIISFIFGCNVSGIRHETWVEIENKSSVELENASVYFGVNRCSWGYVSVGAKKAYSNFTYPITNTAMLSWYNRGKNCETMTDLSKTCAITDSGRLTFIVYDDHVDILFVTKSRSP